MKRLLLASVLILASFTVFAQTSRRQGNVNRTSSASVSSKGNSESTSRRKASSKYEQDKRENTRKNRSDISTDSRRSSHRSVTQERNEGQKSSRGAHSRRDNNNNRETVRNARPSERSHKTTVVVKPENRRSNNQVTMRRPDNKTVVNRPSRSKHTSVVYSTPRTRVRVVNNHPKNYYHRAYRKHRPYIRAPHRVHIVWTRDMYREYRIIYPYVKTWHIGVGTRINSVSAYDAYYHIGEVQRVYGKVREVFYSPDVDEYHLYLGGHYPYHDFTVILPGHIARRISSRPARFFNREYIWVTGYITEFEGRPEMMVKRTYQIERY